ncbi:DUF72 domain-containing protein [Variovorax sp. DT-64]|uniref:DUF72 domain-containing protein n=1 Tax=Variovorax sp. DT-64 TaxID=3396160 RepID=UPI003F1CA8D7
MRSTIPVAESLPTALHVGCAGWSLPRAEWPHFPAQGSHLERYAARFDIAEINSSFYRPHQRETYARWAAGTPAHFRFSAKLPKSITHEKRLVGAMPELEAFLTQVKGLGDKLGCLVVQLPPSLQFDEPTVSRFLRAMRRRHQGPVALEPRHPSWFGQEAERLLARFRTARVLADPVLHDDAAAPGGWPGLVYLRLHGSPRRYWSSYSDAVLQQLAQRLAQAREEGAQCWCVFDNTASGAAVANALTLAVLIDAAPEWQGRKEARR